ncbi:MAG: hypothetical protein ACTHJ5_11110 [Ilyomonas sp.]
MKKITALAIATLISTASLFANPGAKLLKAFNSSFPNAHNVKWHEDDKGFLASFKESDMLVKVNYDKNGEFVSSLRYYPENKLPLNVLMSLKKRFPEKQIFGVTEVTTVDAVNYYVKMQDDKRWYTVKSDANGNLQVVEKFKKQL